MNKQVHDPSRDVDRPPKRRDRQGSRKVDREVRRDRAIEQHVEETIDRTVEDSFPASDPPSWTSGMPVVKKRAETGQNLAGEAQAVSGRASALRAVGRVLAADHGHQLALVHQVHVAAQRRAGPGILRPIHDKLMTAIHKFGRFEIAPKKNYVSLRRKKQFAMIGPATQTRVEVGINLKGLKPTTRLIEMPSGGMCQYKVNVTTVKDVDKELIAWIKQAYDSAG